jgi:hypothetical protein
MILADEGDIDTIEQREPRLARRQDADQFFTKQQRAARQVPSTAGLRLIS